MKITKLIVEKKIKRLLSSHKGDMTDVKPGKVESFLSSSAILEFWVHTSQSNLTHLNLPGSSRFSIA